MTKPVVFEVGWWSKEDRVYLISAARGFFLVLWGKNTTKGGKSHKRGLGLGPDGAGTGGA